MPREIANMPREIADMPRKIARGLSYSDRYVNCVALYDGKDKFPLSRGGARVAHDEPTLIDYET
jgi:hypothetical protein